jgi:hypothetical protein
MRKIDIGRIRIRETLDLMKGVSGFVQFPVLRQANPNAHRGAVILIIHTQDFIKELKSTFKVDVALASYT